MSDVDLPAGYRWATAEETERYAKGGESALPDAMIVTRTFDSSGRRYEQNEADVAVPDTTQWWHTYGGVATEGDMAGLWMQVTAGPTSEPPDGVNGKGVPLKEMFRESNPYLKYLGSFNHEPSELEKDKLAPDDYRTWDDEGNEIEYSWEER